VTLSVRSRRAGLAGLALSVFALLPAAPAAAAPCSGADTRHGAQSGSAYTRAVRCLLNAQRAQAGLAPLAQDRSLARAARRFSRAMVRGRFFDHVSPGGSTVSQRVRNAGWSGEVLGETLAWGTGSESTPAAIVAGWMASPPHRAIIMDGRFRAVGVGTASGSPGGVKGATVTADFGV
jgi:uncharacterized protein YkwD